MCTLTWETYPGGYELHFNRDESRARTRAVPPKLHTDSALSIITPRDPDAGGTWISLNEAGLSLCLLNNYKPEKPYRGVRSRGLLVEDLSSAASVDEATKRMRSQDVSVYSAFDLFIFSVDKSPLCISWNGDQLLEQIPKEPFMSSSGYDTEMVIAGRRAQYVQGKDNGLFAYHRSHHPSCSAYSVCMHRPDAKTQSYSKIRVEEASCAFWYADGPPCSAEVTGPLSISRC